MTVRGSAHTVPIPAGYGYGRPRRRRLLRLATGFVVIVVCLSLLVFGGLLLVSPSVGDAPQIAAAQDASHHVAYPGPADPARFTAALTATEDHRFGAEPGIDPFAVVKAAGGVIVHTSDPGGATIYQQLAKMLYTPGESGVRVEARQVALAVKLWYSYSGRQILQMYADVAYYGNGYYGIRAASCGYFGVSPAELSWPQAAMLAGVVNGPSLDDPVTNPINGRAREAHVIGRLVATGALTQAEANQALAVPLAVMLARGRPGCGA
ncbi:MAG: transglycosylase domain-containing protein [Actinomycetota bacterium]|nr:transglycosylase domain-containing protein [Actinomycetota bacterium]